MACEKREKKMRTITYWCDVEERKEESCQTHFSHSLTHSLLVLFSLHLLHMHHQKKLVDLRERNVGSEGREREVREAKIKEKERERAKKKGTRVRERELVKDR